MDTTRRYSLVCQRVYSGTGICRLYGSRRFVHLRLYPVYGGAAIRCWWWGEETMRLFHTLHGWGAVIEDIDQSFIEMRFDDDQVRVVEKAFLFLSEPVPDEIPAHRRLEIEIAELNGARWIAWPDEAELESGRDRIIGLVTEPKKYAIIKHSKYTHSNMQLVETLPAEFTPPQTDI